MEHCEMTLDDGHGNAACEPRGGYTPVSGIVYVVWTPVPFMHVNVHAMGVLQSLSQLPR